MQDAESPSRPPFLRRPWTGRRIGGRPARSIFLLLGLFAAYVFVLGDSGWFRQLRLEGRRDRLAAEVAALEAESLQLDREIERLETDPDYRERVAREEWGFMRPGERVYHLRRVR